VSLTITTDVFCDGNDEGERCRGWIFGTTGPWSDAKTARSNAAAAGWTRKRVDGKWLDLCPEHSEGANHPAPTAVA
jgi:hypothetical protein